MGWAIMLKFYFLRNILGFLELHVATGEYCVYIYTCIIHFE
jgi:hypothetical protein